MENLSIITSIISSNPTSLGALPMILLLLVGLIVGSYLNVVIYRGSCKYEPGKYQGKLTVCSPKKSFCPECLTTLSAIENIPLFSWIIQGGKCKHCKAPISIQYPLVEASVPILWLWAWVTSPTVGAFLTNALFIALLIAATGIDIKTLKIPNALTLWGSAAILLLAAVTTPETLQDRVLGCLAAATLTYLLVELGKVLFGKKVVKLKPPIEFEWDQKSGILLIQDADKTLKESEPLIASELFNRPTDFIELKGETNKEDKDLGGKSRLLHLWITQTETRRDGPKGEICDKETPIGGTIKTMVFPQEAMGMGDVKLMGLVGAGLGLLPSLHALVLAAICGAIYGIALRLIAVARKQNAPKLIAFGPWISVAAIALLLASGYIYSIF
jgi:prepilin signal peptidase PulO-like enzyme (type II secretory pathway)